MRNSYLYLILGSEQIPCLFDVSGVMSIDSSGILALEEMYKKLVSRNIHVRQALHLLEIRYLSCFFVVKCFLLFDCS